MLRKEDILEAYQRRFACKAYDAGRVVSREDMAFILETARLSPSSFGFEPWRFLVLEKKEHKAFLQEHAWGLRDKVMASSYVVLILVRKEKDLLPDSDYVTHMMKEVHGLPDDVVKLRREFYRHYVQEEARLVGNSRAFFDWACKQSYIALGNMLTTAAMLGIDSTPIEGFDGEALDALLGAHGFYDVKDFRLSVMALFGYATYEELQKYKERGKTRQSENDVILWL